MKKLLAIGLALLLAVGAAVPALADTAVTISGIDVGFQDNAFTVNGKDQTGWPKLLHLKTLEEVVPGTRYFIPFERDNFTWSDGGQRKITKEIAQRYEIGVEYTDTGRYEAVQSVTVAEQDGKMGILIRFVSTFADTKAREFSGDIQVTVGGKAYQNGAFQVKGTISNVKTIIYDEKTVLLGPGRMAECGEDRSGVNFDIGHGMIINAKAKEGKIIYGAASPEKTAQDKEILARYPSIEQAYHIETINLDGRIHFDLPKTYYIYDGQLNYLGTTKDSIRKESLIYLSTEKITK